MIRIIFLLASILVLPHASGFAQKNDADMYNMVRNITVNSKDSIIKAKVIENTLKKEPNVYANYYWYYNNQVNHNTGSYSGKLLHGKYQVFDIQNRLITEGMFQYGVMTGTWKYWHKNGSLKCLAPFKTGKLHGRIDFFNENGFRIRSVDYKYGLLHGKEALYFADTTIYHKYKNGKEIIKKKKEAKKPWFSLKKKKDAKSIKPVKNIESKNSDTIEKKPESNKKKKENWLKKIFKKKELTKEDLEYKIQGAEDAKKNEQQ
jgi:hypothetical protein